MLSRENIDEALTLLEEELRSRDSLHYDLVVCGGSALLALKLATRTTRDVDVIAALKNRKVLVSPDPLPASLIDAARTVGKFLDLPDGWLNTLSALQLTQGFPEGFAERLTSVNIGPSLTLHYASRYDQIHLKLFAYVDLGPGKHRKDLLQLQPTNEEMEAAARWCLSQDAGEVYPVILKTYLTQIGYEDLAGRL